MKPVLQIFFLIAIPFIGKAHVPEHSILCQFHPGVSCKAEVDLILPNESSSILSVNLNIYKIIFKDSIPFGSITALKSKGTILNTQKPSRLYTRTTIPNDSLFSNQNFLGNTIDPGQTVPYGISAIDAWDYGKSGVTANGDSIVIAVIDDGFEKSHRDIDFFINKNEIPNDALDNDGNGAVDDYLGYNTFYNRDSINSQSPTHGTIVSGLIAAKGNNITGVSGVAWNAKILRVNGVTDNWDGVSEAIKAYDYCITMRKLYSSSNKQKGAYIVAVNFSIGQDNGNPDDNLLWGAMYDSLAKVGILAICAVSNSSKDAQVAGDLPTLFHRPNMITVTTLDRLTLGLSPTLGAYSTTYVNISAPHISYTTMPENRFGMPSPPGTSFSTPLVTGAIALMYSNFSSIFLDSLSRNPLKFSLKIKEILLANVDKTILLASQVSSGGKLNLHKTILGVRRYNDSLQPKASIAMNTLDQLSLYSWGKNIILKKSNNLHLSVTVFNILGQVVLRKQINDFESIIPCQNFADGIYIVQIQTENELKSTKLDLR
jgi:hypothetical protein